MESTTDDMAVRSIELCAGVGMLGEGVRAAFEFLGIGHRTVCYVEREAAAAAQLVALMEAGALDAAPVWSDMLTFDGRRFRGLVDCVAAGFPCQDLSVAGRRAGLNEGTRSGLFFRVLDIADDSGASFLVLENVAGIATATATVVDEEEGDLEERAAARVLGELADRGWNAEWITLSASDVGASHGRERWFCFAWRVADPEHAERRALGADRAGCEQGHHAGWREANCGAGIADAALGHAHLQRAHRSGSSRIEARRAEPALSGERMAYPEGDGRNEGRPESSGEQGRPNATKCGGELADTRSTRLARGGAGSDEAGRQEPHGHAGLAGGSLFAPGPDDPRWAGIISQWPGLAPATESGVRMLADGMALVLDESRNHQLRQVGNGVVPLCAAAALVVLVRRSGLLTNVEPLRLAA